MAVATSSITRRALHALRPSTTRGNVVAVTTSQAGVPVERIGTERYDPYAELAYKGNGVVFSCISERRSVFSEVTFRWQRLNDSKLFGTAALGLLERPWPGGTTQTMLDLAMIHNDLGGGAYAYRAVQADGSVVVQMLRPDKVDLVMTPDRAFLAGYLYWPDGRNQGAAPVALSRDEVAQFYTNPDPHHPFKGMSWLTPVLTEIEADKQTERHKQAFLENAATPNLLVKVPGQIADSDAREEFRRDLDRKYGGWRNAYRTLILDNGADAEVIGRDMEQLQFTAVQAAGENRICTAARVPPIVVGIKEGLAAATYSNYSQALRSFAIKMRPIWKRAAGAFEPIVGPLPPGARRLWFDDRDVSAMREDAKDQADVLFRQSQAIRQYVDAGYTAQSAVAAVQANDLSLLVHSGLFSVQLQPASQGFAGDAPDDE